MWQSFCLTERGLLEIKWQWSGAGFGYWRCNYPLWRGYSHCVLQFNMEVTTTKREASFNFITPSFIHSGVRYNEQCYNERLLQRTVFINKVRMLQWTRRNSIGWRSTRVRMTCRAFPLWLDRQSSSLSFVKFSYQFSSLICLFVQCIKVKWIYFILFTHLYFWFCIIFSCLNCCVGW